MGQHVSILVQALPMHVMSSILVNLVSGIMVMSYYLSHGIRSILPLFLHPTLLLSWPIIVLVRQVQMPLRAIACKHHHTDHTA